jgi:hypothetical protein
LAFWFWAFSLAYSSGFFRYHHHTRLPLLAAALLCVVALPASALVQWRRVRRGDASAPAALVAHGLTTLAALALPFGLTLAFSRAPRPWHLEADEAMGAGLDNLALLLVAVACALVLGVALTVRGARRRAGAGRGAS